MDKLLVNDVRPLEEGLTYKLKPVRFEYSLTKCEGWGFLYQDVADDPDTAPLGVHNGTHGAVRTDMVIAALVADVTAMSGRLDQLEELVLAQRRLIDKLEKAKRNAPPAR